MTPVLGQECVASGYGLGRVTNMMEYHRNKVGVTPYVAGYEMLFDVHSVKLVPIGQLEEISI